MSNKSLELWRDSVNEYYSKKGMTYKIPKRGTAEYIAIKKIYEAKKSAHLGKKGKYTKSWKCKCPCKCPK